MKTFDQSWTSAVSTGGLTAVEVQADVAQSAWYVTASAGVSTATFLVQSALSSGGPWCDEGGSTALSSSALLVVRVNGPFAWVRPFINCTGVTIRAIGIGYD